MCELTVLILIISLNIKTLSIIYLTPGPGFPISISPPNFLLSLPKLFIILSSNMIYTNSEENFLALTRFYIFEDPIKKVTSINITITGTFKL